jgi:hypothetical protein
LVAASAAAFAGVAVLAGPVLAVAFFAGAFVAAVFFAVAFFAGAFFALAFVAAVFFAGAFFAGGFVAAVFFADGFFAGAFVLGVFFAGALVAAVFLAEALLAGAACFVATFFDVAFRAGVAFAGVAFFADAVPVLRRPPVRARPAEAAAVTARRTRPVISLPLSTMTRPPALAVRDRLRCREDRSAGSQAAIVPAAGNSNPCDPYGIDP